MRAFSAVCAAASIATICALSRQDVTQKTLVEQKPIEQQLMAIGNAFADEEHRAAFLESFQKAMAGPAHASVPPPDTGNAPQSLMYESALRRKMLEETTKLVHAIEVAKQTGLLSYKNAPQQRSFNAMEAEGTARKIVMALADSLIRSDSRFAQWMPGVVNFYNKFVKNIISAVELLISPNAENKSRGLGDLVASVGVLLSTILTRAVYSRDQIAEAFKVSNLQGFLEILEVVLDLDHAAVDPAPAQ